MQIVRVCVNCEYRKGKKIVFDWRNFFLFIKCSFRTCILTRFDEDIYECCAKAALAFSRHRVASTDR